MLLWRRVTLPISPSIINWSVLHVLLGGCACLFEMLVEGRLLLALLVAVHDDCHEADEEEYAAEDDDDDDGSAYLLVVCDRHPVILSCTVTLSWQSGEALRTTCTSRTARGPSKQARSTPASPTAPSAALPPFSLPFLSDPVEPNFGT